MYSGYFGFCLGHPAGRRRGATLLLLTGLAVSGCHPDTGSGDPVPVPPYPSPSCIVSPPTPPPPAATASDEIFAADRVPRFDIEVSAAAQSELAANEAAGEHKRYVRAQLRYGNEALRDVGLRIKGETNRTPFDRKPAFKIKFDEFVPGQALAGLKRLTLNNLGEDPSAIAERLAYDLFRAAKLPAPRANNAVVYVNGSYYGIYANVESVDKGLLRRCFSDASGNLYEEEQADFLPGNEQNFELQTNELLADRSDLRRLIDTLHRTSATSFVSDMESVLDLERFLWFTALEGLTNHWDMYGYTRFYPNNFHLYADPTSAKFVFIPWGLDMAWKPFRGTAHLPMMRLAHGQDDPSEPISAGLLFQRCLESPGCRARYLATLGQAANLLDGQRLDGVAATYYQQVRDHVYADTRKTWSNDEFEATYQLVIRIIRERADRIRAELASSPP
jgi:spore coat protein CotH